MLDLKAKQVLITGASSGIGLACALQFAKLGANLILIARRKQRLEELALRCEQDYQVSTQILNLDLMQHDDVTKTLQHAVDRVDVLINNAGLAAGACPIQEADSNDWERMIDTNIKGLLYVVKAILPDMIARNAGHIINIGSIAGHEVYPNGTVYCATKHAVGALTRGIKMDVNHTDIRVSSIDPGMVATEFSYVRYAGNQQRADDVYQNMTPLTAEDIADAVIYTATRPLHVNVSQMLILPTDQASATQVKRI